MPIKVVCIEYLPVSLEYMLKGILYIQPIHPTIPPTIHPNTEQKFTANLKRIGMYWYISGFLYMPYAHMSYVTSLMMISVPLIFPHLWPLASASQLDDVLIWPQHVVAVGTTAEQSDVSSPAYIVQLYFSVLTRTTNILLG